MVPGSCYNRRVKILVPVTDGAGFIDRRRAERGREGVRRVRVHDVSTDRNALEGCHQAATHGGVLGNTAAAPGFTGG